MQGLGCLVNITNFEFLCRKLNFVHVGTVKNSIFFIKSARRFRKTISTLAKLACGVCPWDIKTNDTALLNFRAMNDVERNA